MNRKRNGCAASAYCKTKLYFLKNVITRENMKSVTSTRTLSCCIQTPLISSSGLGDDRRMFQIDEIYGQLILVPAVFAWDAETFLKSRCYGRNFSKSYMSKDKNSVRQKMEKGRNFIDCLRHMSMFQQDNKLDKSFCLQLPNRLLF